MCRAVSRRLDGARHGASVTKSNVQGVWGRAFEAMGSNIAILQYRYPSLPEAAV